MAESSPDDVFAATAAGRRSVADLLESLSERQLDTPSLCAGWDIRTVGAHLAEAAAPALGAFVVAVVRAGGRVHRANDAVARRAARRPRSESIALLRARADDRSAPPVTGARGPLTDVLVHEGDMRLPLSLPYDPDPAAVRTALEFVTTGRPVGFVPRGASPGCACSPPTSTGHGVVMGERCTDPRPWHRPAHGGLRPRNRGAAAGGARQPAAARTAPQLGQRRSRGPLSPGDVGSR